MGGVTKILFFLDPPTLVNLVKKYFLRPYV